VSTSKAKMFKGKYEPKLEFPGGVWEVGGGGLQTTKASMGEERYRCFPEQHITH